MPAISGIMNFMIEIVIIIVLLLLLCANIIGFYLILKRKQPSHDERQSLTMLNQNLQGMAGRFDNISHGLNERLDNAAKVISQVSRELGSMQEIGRNMQQLQDFLKSPKLRGNIGEQVLRQMLDQYFPRQLFEMQYRFREGQIVDAIVKTDEGFICIDAKFPMENYQKALRQETPKEHDFYLREFTRDVKKHVDSIAKKYILPDEGTVDFAVMYIPSEAVYYEVIRHDLDLNAYGLERKVLFVSPNSFYYFLRVIMMGMQGKKMEEATRQIIAAIHGIQKDTQRFAETLQTLNTHITHSKSTLERANSDFVKLGGKIERLDAMDETKLITDIK